MDNVVSTFPLPRLPKKAILNTLRAMNYPQIFGISFLSKKTKDLVESLKLTTRTFHVEVRRYFLIMLFFRNYESVCIELCRNDPLRTLETPGSFLIRSEYPRTWNTSMSVGQLLDHLKLICHSSITSLKFLCFGRFSLESVHKNVKDIQKMLLISRSHEQNKRIISVLKPASLTFENRALVNECVPINILIQNFDIIYVTHDSTVQTTLDELLMTNARGIEMTCQNVSVKTFNQFLKLWTKGSNHRLEWMTLRILGNFQKEELLRGLRYRNAPLDTERYFKSSGRKSPREVMGGWDIWRFDGTRATIKNCRGVDYQLFVWHDHCIVN